MALQVSRIGFGQVEPNHLSAQTNGQIYAQLPADDDLAILENGMFLKYNYAGGKADLDGDGEWLLVMNEIKLYDPRKQGLRHYAMKKADFMNGEIVPRLLRTEIGDIYTTNTFGANTSDSATVQGLNLKVTDKLAVDPLTGYLIKQTNETDFIWQVVKEYTMPDGQPGVKIQRIA
jgi:hypothetical protein